MSDNDGWRDLAEYWLSWRGALYVVGMAALWWIAKRLEPKQRKCRACGCTDRDCLACIVRTGSPCFWVEPDLCSACRDASRPDVPRHVTCGEVTVGDIVDRRIDESDDDIDVPQFLREQRRKREGEGADGV